jgi:hypothetical protein
MSALVTNFGMSRAFPTAIGNVWIPHGGTVRLDDDKAIREIGQYPEVKVEQKNLVPAKPKVDAAALMKLPINLLRTIAARAGVKGVVGMKKVDIIKRMEA